MNAFILSLSLFFFSFANFSIKASIISYLLLILFHFKYPFKENKIATTLLLTSLLLLAYLTIGLITSEKIQLIYFLKFLLLFPYFFIFSNYVMIGRITLSYLDSIVKIYILLHATIFSVQLILYLVFGYYLDLNDLIREKDSNTAYLSKDMADMLIPIRATGMYSEPSFYAMAIFPALVYLYNRNIYLKYFLFGLATYLLSFSAAAFVVLFLWLTVQLFFQKGYLKSKITISVLLISAILVMGQFFITRAFESSDYDSVNSRMRIVNELNERSNLRNIFGSGYFLNELEGNGKTNITAAGIRDSGMHLSIFYSGGLIGFFLFLSLLLIFTKNIKITILILISLLFKYGILLTSFWILLILLLVTIHNPNQDKVYRI
ncbi:hypothetical protein AB7V88_06865 [Providencia rettgeri]